MFLADVREITTYAFSFYLFLAFAPTDSFMVVTPPPEVPPRPEQMPTIYSGNRERATEPTHERGLRTVVFS